jgi:hypothetical protein
VLRSKHIIYINRADEVLFCFLVLFHQFKFTGECRLCMEKYLKAEAKVSPAAGNGRQSMKTTEYAVRRVVQVTRESTFLLHPEDDPSLKLSPDTGNPKFVIVNLFLFL